MWRVGTGQGIPIYLCSGMEDLLEKLRQANFVVVLTGAGVSAESGIPTFRGKDGLWKNYRAEELATPYAFNNNPQLVWEFYEWRREIIRKASPNPAHYAIAELERVVKKFLLITQNVDNLHRLAGSQNIIELHGNIFRNRCSDCSKIYQDIGPTPHPPKCECGGLLRPDVVWFGESIPQIGEAFARSSECDLMLVIGTSGIVEPAASLPFYAKQAGAFIIEINLSETPITAIADRSLFGKAGEILPQIIRLKNT